MGLKEEKDFWKWKKKEKEATKNRRRAQREGTVCIICGKGYYQHKDFGELNEHRIQAGGSKKQWVLK